ncbi:MAG: Uma2 family endonuclease [Bryobacteraceae bacterium]|jgi:Uma2 family endonuclease
MLWEAGGEVKQDWRLFVAIRRLFLRYPLSMGAKTAVPAHEYLHTSFPDVDREYRDGELVERTMPDYLHGRTQPVLGVFFEALRRKLPVYACSETRMKLREDLYLIADLAVFWPSQPALLPNSPPLVAIEVLSPDDRLTAVREKLQEYRAWGVSHVWLVDPHSRRLYTRDTRLIEVTSFTIPELDIQLGPTEIFD